MTETISYIKNSLRNHYPTSEIQAFTRLIMERICGIPVHKLLLGKGTDLSDTEKSQIANVVKGLQSYKPIQYLLGVADFCGLEFKVTPSVLIPRPETEELVRMVAADYAGKSPRILDIGTGSGCIAISLAKQLPEAKVTALDISPEALAIAKENAEKNQVSVSFIQADILSEATWGASVGCIDCIISNPPYVTNKEKAAMEANVLDNEPHLALFVPDSDPLLFYRAIARFGQLCLPEKGSLYFETNALYGQDLIDMLNEADYKEIALIPDFYGKDRFIKAKR